MANQLYNSMQNNSNNFLSSLNSLRKNPMQFLMQHKFNIPQEIQNDPNAIIQHLMNTGQVSQEQYNRVMSRFKK